MATAAESRAATAESAVTAQFGRRLLGVPFTHLARVSSASPGWLENPWHYWWQAHYVDALVDAAHRHHRQRDLAGATSRARLADRVVATVWLRDGLSYRNDYHDDIAWLALTVRRLRRLHHDLGGRRAPGWLDRVERSLTAQLRPAVTADLGGGVFWSTARDFKNVPTTGPVALLLARQGDRATARTLVNWMYERLHDAGTGLLQDGVRLDGDREQLVSDRYTYNQGTVLAALVELGDAVSLSRAAAIVSAVDNHLTRPVAHAPVLVTHGGGDGGLFTGILARYLALAATHRGLPDPARQEARRMVVDTAEALWEGRRRLPSGHLVFPAEAGSPAEVTQVVELSTQVQAWTVLEAAALL